MEETLATSKRWFRPRDNQMCATELIVLISSQQQPARFIKRKQSRLSTDQPLIRRHLFPLSLSCEGFTCNRLHSGEKQIPFQPSSPPDPLYLPGREQLHTSPTKRLITEPPPHTYIPPLVQPRKSQNCMLGIDKQRFTPLVKSQMSACVFPVSPLPSCTVVWHI